MGHGPSLAHLACGWVPFAVAAGLGAGVPTTAARAPPPPPVRFDSLARAPRDNGGFTAIPAGTTGAFGNWDFQADGPYSGHAASIEALAGTSPELGPSAIPPSFDNGYEVTPPVGGPPTELTIPVTRLPISAVSEPSLVLLLPAFGLALLLHRRKRVT